MYERNLAASIANGDLDGQRATNLNLAELYYHAGRPKEMAEHAAETLWAALRHARVNSSRRAASRRTLSATTRDFGDAVVSLLAASHRNAEFVPESAA